MKRVCVFCGSSPGANPLYRDAGREVGRILAERGLGLVYGGSRVGVMGAVAEGALGAGGAVIGVIPRSLLRYEVGHYGLTELIVVESMHERKNRMAELSDGFLALPGGSGTLEEFFEVLTWAQIGIHRKPCALLNVAAYFDPLLAMMDHAVAERFLSDAHRALILTDTDPRLLLDAMEVFQAPATEKWMDRDET